MPLQKKRPLAKPRSIDYIGLPTAFAAPGTDGCRQPKADIVIWLEGWKADLRCGQRKDQLSGQSRRPIRAKKCMSVDFFQSEMIWFQ